MKLLMKFFGVIAFLAIAFVLIGFFLPSDIEIERTIEVKTEPEVVYSKVSNLKEWSNWSFWDQIDPEMKSEYSDPATGVGSWHSWESNHKEVGNGKMTVSKADAGKYIAFDMDFDGQGTANADYTFEKTETGTKVTSKFNTEMKGPIWSWMGLLMKGHIENSMQSSLNGLKEVAEAAPPVAKWKMSPFEVKNMPEMNIYSVMSETPMDQLGPKMQESFGAVMALVQKSGAEMSGPPLAVYHEWAPQDNRIKMECGMPVAKAVKGDGLVKVSKIPSNKVVMTKFYGNYDDIGNAHEAIEKYMQENNLQVAGSPWEWYITDPTTVSDPSKIETQVYYPVKN